MSNGDDFIRQGLFSDLFGQQAGEGFGGEGVDDPIDPATGLPVGVPEGAEQRGANTWVLENPRTNRLEVYTREYDPLTELPIGFVLTDDIPLAELDGGAGGDPFAGAKLAEMIRSNKAQEALAQRRLALDTATNALAEMRQLLPFTVEPGKEFFSGFGPEGLLAGFSQEFGLPFEPVPIQHQQVQPGALGAAVLSPEIQQMLSGVG